MKVSFLGKEVYCEVQLLTQWANESAAEAFPTSIKEERRPEQNPHGVPRLGMPILNRASGQWVGGETGECVTENREQPFPFYAEKMLQNWFGA
eukprot:1139555-Pelagomonas_calceolata.AAC.5